jgi:SP family arabinose:H+ symporter-like MFS transporter
MRLTPTLIKSTVVAALGGLLFGFDTAVISGTTAGFKHTFALSNWGLGFTVAIALVGTILGASLAGLPGDRYGRRDSLRVMAILYLVSALGCGLAWNWDAVLIFRFIGGVGVGGSSVLGPMYIAEIAPAKWRGRLVGVFQVNVVIGILLAYFSNYLIGRAAFGPEDWRWMLGVSGLPALFFFVMLYTIPRSPRWLMQKGRKDEARTALQLVGEQNIDAELDDIARSIDIEHGHGTEPLFSRKYAKPIFLAVSIAAFNQLSGINAILYYLNDIFARAGFSKMSGDLQAVLIGFTNLIFTLFAMSIIDRFGRKKLLIVGAAGMTVCLAGVAIIFFMNSNEWLLVWLLVGFIAFFAFSQGAVIWVYISEVFPNRVRAKGQSLGTLTHWLVNAVISFGFPQVAAHSRGAPFVFFSAMMLLMFFVVLFYYPETKGITLEDMQRKLGIA